MDYIEIDAKVRIAKNEIKFRFSRSSGPGGQHVNKVNTRVSLIWSVSQSDSILPSIKDFLLAALAKRLNQEGELVIHSDQNRSQIRNREHCIEKLQKTVRAALVVPKKRRPTKPSRTSVERRIQEKKGRSDIKGLRKKPKY